MHPIVQNLLEINNNVKSKIINNNELPKIIAVSKTFSLDKIKPIIEFGHKDFGENKVQEAIQKWTNIKSSIPDLKLHMIGKLQTNKVKYVVPLFDYIHSLDNLKLAKKISLEQKKENKDLKIFIQINIGNEKQKNGIDIKSLKEFYEICSKELSLNIIGLMCIPPSDKEVLTYFKKMQELKKNLGLKELSMGMSSDYLEAVNFGSTFIRIGSKIFGDRA
tara:strand:+ start:31 stop:687 length:657 start_codon:yes stop_codon:yes gene_type:complete